MRRARRRRRSSGSRLFRYDRGLGTRFVAGADEAGRGCLAGPLVAAAVLFDYEKLTLADLRSLSALNDSKQHNMEMREMLYPRVMRAATAVAARSTRGYSVSRISIVCCLESLSADSDRRSASVSFS